MPADLIPLRNSVVRVLSPDAIYFGLGYRVAHDLVVSCAHVVAAALDTEANDPVAPTGNVLVDVPFVPQEQAQIQRTAEVEPGGWLPACDGKSHADLVLLRVDGAHGNLPLPGPPASLNPTLSLRETVFHAYAGPEGHHRHLVHLDGRVRALIANGRWQLSVRDSDFAIEPGCSGAPAVDGENGQVIGLIAQDEQDPSVSAGFLIPAAHIRVLLEQAGLAQPAIMGLEALRRWLDVTLPSSYEAEPVHRFVDHYGGSQGRPMPFAGRDEILDTLDKKLASGGGTFVLVSGVAGVGKSALLLHWVARQLRITADLRLLFLPVSIRFDTADEMRGLRLLHAQLKGLFNEVAFPEGSKPDQDDYRDRIAAGWQAMANRLDERFLLAVDGADEAVGDWLMDGVLPYAIPANLTIVLSARHKPGDVDGRTWFSDYSFAPECLIPDPVELEPLSRQAVGEAIAQLGCPLDALPEREGMLDALYRLTDEGDPLLVGLWVGQLWKEREQAFMFAAADLDLLHPGYRGLVDVWLREQESLWKASGIDANPDDLCRLLRVLALARSPLLLRDWLAVVGCLPIAAPWDYERARKVLDNAYRLVVGDAERHGYAFVHPRLADHFLDQIAGIKNERSSVPNAYLDWGGATVAALNEGRLSPEQCPTYLLRHYFDHVQSQCLPPDKVLDQHLLALLGDGWLQAWEEEEGAYRGYLADLKRIQEVIRKANENRVGPPYRIGAELRCALQRASVYSLNENLSSDLIAACAEARLWTIARAVRVATDLSDYSERAKTLIRLAGLVAGQSRQEITIQAVESARRCDDEELLAEALSAFAEQKSTNSKLIEQLLESARSISNECARARAVGALAGVLEGDDHLKLLEEALEIARQDGSPGNCAGALAAVSRQVALPKRQSLVNEALEAVSSLADEMRIERNRMQSIETERMLEIGLFSFIGQNLEPLSEKTVSRIVSDALIEVARQLPDDPLLLRKARSLVQRIDEYSDRARVLMVLAERVSQTERQELVDEALKAAYNMDRRYGGMDFVRSLTAVAARLTGKERKQVLRDALQCARGEHRAARSKALAIVAGQLGDEERRQVLTEALAVMRRLHDDGQRAVVLAKLAECLEEDERRKLLEESLDALRKIEDDKDGMGRGIFLSLMRESLNGQQEFIDEAMEMSASFSSKFVRAKTLLALAKQLPMEERQNIFNEVLRIVSSIHKLNERTSIWEELIREIQGSSSLLQRALEVIEGVDSARARASVLVELIKQSKDMTDILGRVRLMADALPLAGCRAEVLTALAAQSDGVTRREILEQALEAARSISFPIIPFKTESDVEWDRAVALAVVAQQLSGEERMQVLAEALTETRCITNEESRVFALSAVAKRLPEDEELLGEALEVAGSICNQAERAKAIRAIAQPLARIPVLLGKVLDLVRGIQDEVCRAHALEAVSVGLGGEPELLAMALELARAIGNEGRRSEVLFHLAKPLLRHPSLLEEALEEIRVIDDSHSRARALRGIVEQLATKEEFWVSRSRMNVRPELAPDDKNMVAPLTDREGLFGYRLFARILSIAGNLQRLDLLLIVKSLTPVIVLLGGASAIRETAGAIRDTARWWP